MDGAPGIGQRVAVTLPVVITLECCDINILDPTRPSDLGKRFKFYKWASDQT